MGILALAAIPLLQLVNNSIRGSANLEHRLLARTVAENVLVERIIGTAVEGDKPIIETGTSQQYGMNFNWVVTSSPVQDLSPQLVLVEVTLEDKSQVLAQLTGVRLPAAPSQFDVSAENTTADSAVESGGVQ